MRWIVAGRDACLSGVRAGIDRIVTTRSVHDHRERMKRHGVRDETFERER